MADTRTEKPQSEATIPLQEGQQRMGLGRYLLTRISTLKPPMNRAPNPIKSLMLLNREQWLFFMVRAFPFPVPVNLLIVFFLGCVLRLVVGLVRFLHSLLDNHPARC